MPTIAFRIPYPYRGSYITRETGCHTSRPTPIHRIGKLVRICPLTHGRQLLLTVKAFAAGELEGYDDTVANLNLLGAGSHALDNATELVAQDITLLEFRNSAYEEASDAMLEQQLIVRGKHPN